MVQRFQSTAHRPSCFLWRARLNNSGFPVAIIRKVGSVEFLRYQYVIFWSPQLWALTHPLYRDNHYSHMQNYPFSRPILVYEILHDVPKLWTWVSTIIHSPKWASKMAQCIKKLAIKTDKLSSIPRTTWWKEGVDWLKLHPHLHSCTVSHAFPLTHKINRCNEDDKSYNQRLCNFYLY